MKTEEMICELRRLEEAHKDDFVGTCETNWSLMCRDVANRLEELLAAQKPRVMTLEEVKSAWRNRDIAFLVEYNDGGNPVWMLYYGYLSTQEEIVLIDEIAHLRHFGIYGYGIDWRVWTSRPTDEQREAEPWDC